MSLTRTSIVFIPSTDLLPNNANIDRDGVVYDRDVFLGTHTGNQAVFGTVTLALQNIGKNFPLFPTVSTVPMVFLHVANPLALTAANTFQIKIDVVTGGVAAPVSKTTEMALAYSQLSNNQMAVELFSVDKGAVPSEVVITIVSDYGGRMDGITIGVGTPFFVSPPGVVPEFSS